MLVYAYLDRAIVHERSRTLCRFQRFQLRDGPDLTTIFQPDSALTPPAQSHHMAVQQLAAFSTWARHRTTTPVCQPLTSTPAVGWPAGSPPPDTLSPDFYVRWPHRPRRLHPVPRRRT